MSTDTTIRTCLADRIRIYLYEVYDKPSITYKSSYTYKLRNTPRLSKESLDRALSVYNTIRGDIFLNGKNPRIVAAALMYISCVMEGDPVTQEDICILFHCSHNAIRNMYKKLRIYFHL